MLCLGTSVVAIGWESIWVIWGPIFGLGIIIPVGLAGLVVLMGISLGLIQIVKWMLGYNR